MVLSENIFNVLEQTRGVTPSREFKSGSELDVSSFIFPENPNYKDVYDLDMSEMLKKLKKRYPPLAKFKSVSTYSACRENLEPFINFMKENPEKAHDVILDDEIFFGEITASVPYFQSFTVIDGDFALAYRREFLRGNQIMFIFFNDYKKIKEKFFKEDPRVYKPGIYELCIRNNEYALNALNLKNIEKPILDQEIAKKIHNDIICFFDNEEFYRANFLDYKRGLLVHGPHGNGKTTLIKDVLESYGDAYRLMVDCNIFEQDLYDFIKTVFPTKGKKIITFEDVEAIGSGNRSYAKRSSFLNFIDGAKVMENTLFIATTNHPDLVDPALIDRPSRFDRIYKVGLPNKDCREKFLLKYFPHLSDDSEQLEEFIDETKGFSGAYFKELFIVVGIQKSTISEAIQDLKTQIKVRSKGDFDDKKGVGLNRG